MAVSLADRVAKAIDPDFQRQVRMAVFATALAVADEPVGTTPPSAYLKRQTLAQQVLSSAPATPQFVERFAWAVAAALTQPPTDAVVQQVVADNWSRLAGVTALDVA